MAGVRAEPAAGQQGWWWAKASLGLTSLWGLWLGPLHLPFLTSLLQPARGEPPGLEPGEGSAAAVTAPTRRCSAAVRVPRL